MSICPSAISKLVWPTLALPLIVIFSAASFLGIPGSIVAQPQIASLPAAGAVRANTAATSATPSIATAPGVTLPIKPEPKKARESYKRGLKAEESRDWTAAREAYAEAINWDPGDHEYLLRRDLATSHLVQEKADLAERDAISGRLKEARKELIDAIYLDPDNSTVRERLTELTAFDTASGQQKPPAEIELSDGVHLNYQPGTRSFNFRGDTQGVYDEVARQFGVRAAFDLDLRPVSVHFQADNVDFPTAMRLLGDMTGTFWRALARTLFFVSQDTPQKRRDYEPSVVRTIALPASETPEQMTETLRILRDITGITRANLDTSSRMITLRASPQAMAVATGLIDDLQKPVGELIIEVEVLEVDRSYAQQLGITPPQSTRIVSLSSQEIQEAQQSIQGLVNVITSLFGTPSSLSGLSASQITSLLSSGQLSAGALLPPLVAFGGGDSTFLATLPGAAANFSEMLSLVEHGRRILLRAEDGQPATFFVGDRVPVELSNFSSSLSGTGTSVAGLSGTNFPTTNYEVGATPTAIATASLRDNGFNDLVVTNFNDNTVSVLLGNGAGTFTAQVTYPTGVGPASVSTGAFRSVAGDENLDLAIANQTANTISILIGNGDGTFQPKTDIAAGSQPVSVIAKNMHDLNGNGSLDLIVANHSDSTIYIYQGNGDGTFKTPSIIQLPAGFAPSSITAGDFNSDGHLDLAVADEGNATVSVFLGNGDGTFRERTDYAVGNSPVWVSTADLNGDTTLDLAVANKGDNTVSVLLGNGTTTTTTAGTTTVGNGTFAQETIYPAGGEPTSISVSDYNIDGLPDLAVADASDNAVSVLLNLGSGTFGPNFELAAGTAPDSIVTADFNGDSKPDVATANNGSDNVSVILNSSNFSPTGNTPFNTGAFPGVQYIDIGLKVKATPRIHLDGDVTLQLEFDISSLSGQAFNTIPVISNDTVSQTVRVKQNETAVLTGLLQRQLSNAINGTPGLSQIPEIGFFAGNHNAQDQDNELLILVTPRMVRFAQRTDHAIYAGQGSLEGPAGNGPAPIGAPPPPPPQPATTQPAGPGQEQQPGGVPQPTNQVGTPIAPTPQAPAPTPNVPEVPPPGQQTAPAQPQQPQPQQQQPPPQDQSQQTPPQQR
jgi:hypothetical protein